jgi:CRISPR/Cas system-associated exonuclease Cas4 (RecB family)
MNPPLTSWSFSKLMVFEECPWHAYLQWVARVPDQSDKTAADRGTAIHAEAENYVKTGKGFTSHLAHFTEEFEALHKHYEQGKVTCEEEWGFDKDWQPCGWNKAWLRLKCDVVCHLEPKHIVVIDHKSGRRFGNELKHAQQLQLYSVSTLIRYPEIQHTTNELWYLDKDELASFQMTRKQLEKYLRMYDKRGRAMTEATSFPAKPNLVSCKYCPYAPQRQGDCKYGIDATKVPVQSITPIHVAIKANKKAQAKTRQLFADDDLSRYL